jgi:hypothetical protein
MPGAGKTIAAAALQRQAWPVIGEYTSSDGTTAAVSKHPDVEDDHAHLANWLRKAAQRGPDERRQAEQVPVHQVPRLHYRVPHRLDFRSALGGLREAITTGFVRPAGYQGGGAGMAAAQISGVLWSLAAERRLSCTS